MIRPENLTHEECERLWYITGDPRHAALIQAEENLRPNVDAEVAQAESERDEAEDERAEAEEDRDRMQDERDELKARIEELEYLISVA